MAGVGQPARVAGKGRTGTGTGHVFITRVQPVPVWRVGQTRQAGRRVGQTHQAGRHVPKIVLVWRLNVLACRLYSNSLLVLITF